MKNSEEAIERVLTGLRDVEAPEGMERRILAELEERAAVQERSRWRSVLMSRSISVLRERFAAGGLGWRWISGAVLAGAVLVLAIPAMRRVGRMPAGLKIVAGPVLVAPSVEGTRNVKPSSQGRGVPLKGTKDTSETWLVRAPDSVDALALSETQAASFPAPPMPLTEQERLLLRFVHKADPVEMAMLDPRLRALQDAEEKAEFQRFFGQTTEQTLPIELTPGQSATTQAAPQQSTTELTAPEQPTTEQPMPQQAAPEQQMQDQPTQEPPKPQNVGPDQSTTQQLMPRPIRTGEDE